MNSALFTDDDNLVMLCLACEDFPPHSVVFYEKNDDQWVASESIQIDDYMANMVINGIKTSADGSSLAISINNRTTTDISLRDDAILIFRSINDNWQLVKVIDDISNSGLQDTPIVLEFSSTGDFFVISSTPAAQFSVDTDNILSQVYYYDNGQYILENQLEQEFILSGNVVSLSLLDDNKTMILSPKNASFNWQTPFAYYSLLDSELVEELPFGENGFDIVYTGFVESDSSAHRIVISQGTRAQQQVVAPQIVVYERDTSTEGWEQVLPSYFSLSKEHEINDLAMSHGGDMVSVVMTDFVSANDTSSYVDYLREVNGQLRLLHRFTYKVPNNDGLYGDVYRSDLSKTGRYMTVNRLAQVNLYDMSNLLPDSGGSEFPPVVIFPNPTTGIVSTTSINFIKVEVYNSLGQRIKTIDSQIIDLSEIAAGLYFLSFTLADGTERAAKLIKQ
ncbi:MAG: hypothetical protein ACJATI_004598 [Halioglobus sp.]|jgi:hypothetical protein